MPPVATTLTVYGVPVAAAFNGDWVVICSGGGVADTRKFTPVEITISKNFGKKLRKGP